MSKARKLLDDLTEHAREYIRADSYNTRTEILRDRVLARLADEGLTGNGQWVVWADALRLARRGPTARVSALGRSLSVAWE